jgi:penicillin-binding protein 2
MARKLGLGERQGIEIGGEGPGLIPDRAWKKKRFNQPWHQGETLNTAIGQGHVLATPLQLATMTARLVNGGKSVQPRLIRSMEEKGNQLEKPRNLGFNLQHLAIIRKGMDAVVNDPRGTAYASRLTAEGFSLGGKTGTAQVRRITLQQRAAGVKNESLPWKQRHHALFVGYGPIEKPRYVVSVIVEHGVGGSKAAAPMGRDLIQVALKRDPRHIRAVDETDTSVEKE